MLEAMQEGQVTIGEETYSLEKPFIVIATQNPLEQQGTYPLPEAQQDRFMLKLKVSYPMLEEEKRIIRRFTGGVEEDAEVKPVLSRADIFDMRKKVESVYVDESIENYVLNIVFKTRGKSQYISCGASPRASISLIKAAKAMAFLHGRNFVTPDDIKAMVFHVLRHRIILSYEAEAEDITVEKLISEIMEQVNLP